MTTRVLSRRCAILLLAGPLLLVAPPAIAADEEAWAALSRPGTVVLMRHAKAPGVGDPPQLRLGDCTTQRNLSAEGREQARRVGEAIKARRIRVDRVLASQWCRAHDTAVLAFGAAEPLLALNSFFSDRSGEAAQVAAMRAAIESWRGEGLLVMVTHQVNITALSGIVPREGELVVVRTGQGGLRVEARLAPAP